MLALDSRAAIRVEYAKTASSMDESLLLIQQYLSQRLDKGDGLAFSSLAAEVIIHLSVLGTIDYSITDKIVPSWQHRITYPIKLCRSLVILGPLYTPARTDSPCPHCMERRWVGNRTKEEQMALLYAQQSVIFGRNPRVTPFALETIWFVLTESQRPGLISPRESGEYPFYTLDLETLQLSRHHLMQDSSCPVCAMPAQDTAEAAIIQLESRPKRDISDYRLVKATEYDLPMSGFVNSVSGVLGPMAAPDFLNTLSAPVSGIFRVRSKYGVHDAWWSGHGNDYHQSLYLGILEGIERYAGHTPHGKRVVVFDSYENLAPDALDPRECGQYPEEYYRRSFPFYQPFTPERKIPWVWGYSFGKGRPILVPEQLVYYLDYRRDLANAVQDCSNGCATGSCLEEAIFYGLLELIERDAFLITWYARLAPPRIDPRSCRRPETLFVLEGIEKQGYQLYLFDTRLDVRIPSVLGVARLREPDLGNIVLAAGSGLDPEDAVRGALCEIACYIPDFRQRVVSKLDALREMVHDYSRVRELSHHALLHGLPEMAPHSAFLFQNPLCRSLEETYRDWMEVCPRNQDLRDDLLFCIEIIMKLGMDIIVVDQTCPEQARTGLKTACVIVPGLLPIDFGWERHRVFDLPRLRTVPRTAGFRETDFEPDIHDVVPHPFP